MRFLCLSFFSLLALSCVSSDIGTSRIYFEAANEAAFDFRLRTFISEGQKKFPEKLHFDGLDFSPGYSEVWLYAIRNLRIALAAEQPSDWEALVKELSTLESRVVTASKKGEQAERKVWKAVWEFWKKQGLDDKIRDWAKLPSPKSVDVPRQGGALDIWRGKPAPQLSLQGESVKGHWIPRSATVELSNGVAMPVLGLGTTMLNDKPGEEAVIQALAMGYRLIDTAQSYRNERQIGNAWRRSNVARGDVFICTKVSNPEDFSRLDALFKKQLKALQTNYIDLYFIHNPDDYPKGPLKAWKTMEKLYNAGKIKSLGVSNFSPDQLRDFMKRVKVPPHVIQNKFSIYHWGFGPEPLQYWKSPVHHLAEFNDMGVVLMGYATIDCYPFVKQPLQDAHVRAMAGKYGKTSAQILLRHALQRGATMIPKSGNATRLEENARVFDFSISADDLALLDGLPHFTSPVPPAYLPDAHGAVKVDNVKFEL